MFKKMLKFIISAVSVFPTIVLAQNYTPSGGIAGLITWFNSLLNLAFPVLISLAVLYFIFQVFKYAIAGDEDKKKQAKGQIIYGIVALFIMVSVWGIVNILQSTFGVGTGVTPIVSPLLPN